MRKFIHMIAHKLGWYSGTPDSHWEGNNLIMCFKCGECGRLSSCDKVPDYIVYPERYENPKKRT